MAGLVKKAEPEQGLCEWLNTCKGVRNAEPVFVVLSFPNGKTVEVAGALYENYSGDPLPGSKAAQEPEKYPPKWEPRLYLLLDWHKLLEEMRRKKKRHARLCWKFCTRYEQLGKQQDQRDWFCAGYSPADPIEDKFKEFHPFGAWTGFHAWEVPDGTAIDHYEPEPYQRLRMEVRKIRPEKS